MSPTTPAAGLAALTGLTSLDLTPDTWAAEAALMPSLAQLTSLRHLGLDGPSPALLAGLPQLTALQQLSSLALLRADLGPATEHGAQPLQALLQLLQGLRDSSDSTAGGSSSSRRQQGLRQLRLASSQSDPDAAASRLPLSALRGLEGLSVAYPSLQVRLLLPCCCSSRCIAVLRRPLQACPAAAQLCTPGSSLLRQRRHSSTPRRCRALGWRTWLASLR